MSRWGLRYRGEVSPAERSFPSLVIGGTSLDVVSCDGPVALEFGNHGARFLFGADRKASRRGYVAIRHGLGLPPVFLEAVASGPVTLLAFAQFIYELTPLDSGEAPSASPLAAFKHESVRIDLGAEVKKHFNGYCAEADLGPVRQLLSEEALRLFLDLAQSFDLEITQDWLLVYSSYGDVVTSDPEIWEWVFSVTSRLLVQMGSWQARSRPGASALEGFRALPFFNDAVVDRPAKLDNKPAKSKDQPSD